MKRDDPTPTYRGYRRQALYVLFRLFDDALGNDAVIQPEGLEDLAIRDQSGQLVEVAQVKDRTANLVASSFGQFFYERIAAHCASDSQVVVRIASFGPIGPDLLAATNGDADAKARIVETISKDRKGERRRADGTKEKFTKHGLPTDQATRFIERVKLHRVTEAELTEAILTALGRSVAGVSPRDAFEFLMWWMLTLSEDKRSICRRDAIQKLTNIGRFLAGRTAFHAEWHQSIIPLDDSGAEAALAAQYKLKDEFFRGGRVQFRHILADVDVPRTGPLTKVHLAFSKSDVVVVHSASGQGKTTLAFRYLKEFAPAAFRLQLLTAEGLKHARQMALAIRQQTEALSVPTIVYVDVRPGDSHWIELVRELSSQPLIRVLVTIREEDWQRSNVSAADFLFVEISLDFDESEARSIYESLREQQLAKNHLDFEEAWTTFGPRKSLLEFVYFVTQAETLTDRIKAQVRAFQDEVRSDQGNVNPSDESLLRLVAVASSYEGRLDVARTIAHCGIASPMATLRRFEDEYFIRKSGNGRLLDGFHAIRSEVLCECLTNHVVFPWGDVAAQVLPLMEESDLEAFLLCAFSRRRDAVPSLLKSLDEFSPKTWSGVCGVMRALMWLGLRNYWEASREVVDEAFAENPGGWFLMFDWDVAQVLGENDLFEKLGAPWEVAAARSKQLREKQANRSVIFAPVCEWLSSRSNPPSEPTDQSDCQSAAEVMFWCGHLEIASPLVDAIDVNAISRATESLPLYRVGELMRGLREAAPELVQAWWDAHCEAFLERLRKEAAIAKWDESDEAVVAHYIIDLDFQATRLSRGNQTDETAKASLHDLSIERVDLLSQLISGKQKYGAVGYGHRMSIFATPYDETEKPGVLAENLHPHWATRFNALSRGHSEHRFRPTNWQEFFARLTELREQILRCLADLRDAVSKSRQNPTRHAFIQQKEAWDDCRKAFNAGVLFPKCAVDEWGFSSESASTNENAPAQSTRQSAVSRFDGFRNASSEFRRTVYNFLNQALGVLVLAPALRKAKDAATHQQMLNLALTQLGTNENSIRLSVINGFDACAAIKQLHSAFEQTESLHEWRDLDLERRESRTFIETMDDWAAFAFPPERRNLNLAFSRCEPFAWILRPLRGRLENRLQRLTRQRISATILPNVIVWDGKPGLWIAANVNHPVETILALPLIWEAIRRAFDSDTKNPAQYCATKLVWEEIVVVMTINHRSLEQTAHRHFKFTAFGEERSFGEVPWATVPDPVPTGVWKQTGIEFWEPTAAMALMDRLVASYVVLLQHVQHMADFVRIPDTDELGMSILQEYLNRESKRAEPMLQATYDSFGEVLNLSTTFNDLNESPNLVEAIQALLALKNVVPPRPDELSESEQPVNHQLSIDEIAEWRDRLTKGIELVGQARLFWMAHLLRCPMFRPTPS